MEFRGRIVNSYSSAISNFYMLRQAHINKQLGRIQILIFAIVILRDIIPSSAKPNEAFTATVIGITDGYTITVLHLGKQRKIRLYGIDFPERHQPYYRRARQFTAEKIHNKKIDVLVVDRDRYGRSIGWIYYGGRSLNHDLIQAGLVWHSKKYSNDVELADLERSVRKNQTG